MQFKAVFPSQYLYSAIGKERDAIKTTLKTNKEFYTKLKFKAYENYKAISTIEKETFNLFAYSSNVAFWIKSFFHLG